MANQIFHDAGETGLNLYALIADKTAQMWNGSAFETIAAANWDTYDRALTEYDATGIYSADFPPAIPAGVYNISIRTRAGATPATTDPVARALAVYWDGSSVTLDPAFNNVATVEKIFFDYAVTGKVLYALVSQSGRIYDGTATLATIAAASWAAYAIPLTEQDGTGIYTADFPAVLAAGLYEISVRLCAGATPAIYDSNVRTQAAYYGVGATTAYCTAAEIKAAMPDGNWGTSYDTLLATLAEQASRMIDQYLRRKPGAFAISRDTVRYFDGNGKQRLSTGELAAAPTSVQVAETGDLNTLTTWAATDYILYPLNAADDGKPYTHAVIDTLYGSKAVWCAYPKAVRITGKFGYATSTPGTINRAAIIQAVRWFKRGQNAYADTGAIVELGQLTHTKKLDPEVELILAPFKLGPH